MALSTLRNLVDNYMFDMIELDAPDWYINPTYRVVLRRSSTVYNEISASTPLKFAPGMLDVLQSKTPPPPDFFLSTPTPAGKFWAIYAGLLRKPGCPDALCIGSGTDALASYEKRIAHYSNKTHGALPRFVRSRYDEGYDLAHIGVLCWSPIPDVTMVPRARLRMIALEGTFTNLFFSANETCLDCLWTNLMPWTRDQVDWITLNSHTPFNEGVAGLSLTAVELLQLEDARRLRMKQHSKKSYAKHSAKMRAVYDRERATDITAFRLKKSQQAASWVSRNVGKSRAADKRTRAKALAEKRFHCEDCKKSFIDSSKLNRHLTTDKHAINKASSARAAVRSNLDVVQSSS